MCSTLVSSNNIFLQREGVIGHCIYIRSKKWWISLLLLNISTMLTLSRLYVQEILTLSNEKPCLYQQFIDGKHRVRCSTRYGSGLWSELVIEQTLMRSLNSSRSLTRSRGFEDNVRHLWVKSVRYTSAVHESMISLSGVHTGSSDQNKEMGFAKWICDFEDCNKIYNRFVTRNPFNIDDKNLHPLSTGVVAVHGKDAVKCYDAEIIGSKIQESLGKFNFTDAHIKVKDQLHKLINYTLGDLARSVKTDGKSAICVNCTL